MILDVLLWSVQWSCTAVAGDDWPTALHDAARSAATEMTLPRTLVERWRWLSIAAPRPAWYPEAKWDGYNRVYELADRLDFDRAFQPVIVGRCVYFGSSVDDQLRCLNLEDGTERWTFFAEGPIRLSPTVSGSSLYFGADDGCLYALDKDQGTPRWKQRIAPEDRRVPNDGAMISQWPVRSGVVVMDDTVYCAAGVFPWARVYLCAVAAQDGERRWTTELTDLTAQGYLLASLQRLYLPNGRDRPVVFDRAGGKRLFQAAGAGGAYALLVDDQLVHGPGRTGSLSLSAAGAGDQIAGFDGSAMVVAEGMAFLLSRTELTALDRTHHNALAVQRAEVREAQVKVRNELDVLAKDAPSTQRDPVRARLAELGEEIDRLSRAMDECRLWAVEVPPAYSMIVCGDTVVIGADHRVLGFATKDGAGRFDLPVMGRAFALAAAGDGLLVSTDQGTIHAFGVRR